MTSAYEHIYLDLSYQDSSEEEDSFSGANYYENFSGDRRDYSATVGMRILGVNQYDFENLKDNSATKPLPDKVEETMYTGKISISCRF